MKVEELEALAKQEADAELQKAQVEAMKSVMSNNAYVKKQLEEYEKALTKAKTDIATAIDVHDVRFAADRVPRVDIKVF